MLQRTFSQMLGRDAANSIPSEGPWPAVSKPATPRVLDGSILLSPPQSSGTQGCRTPEQNQSLLPATHIERPTVKCICMYAEQVQPALSMDGPTGLAWFMLAAQQ